MAKPFFFLNHVATTAVRSAKASSSDGVAQLTLRGGHEEACHSQTADEACENELALRSS